MPPIKKPKASKEATPDSKGLQVRPDRTEKNRLVIKVYLHEDPAALASWLDARGLLGYSTYIRGSVKHIRIVDGAPEKALDAVMANKSAAQVKAIVKEEQKAEAKAKADAEAKVKADAEALALSLLKAKEQEQEQEKQQQQTSQWKPNIPQGFSGGKYSLDQTSTQTQKHQTVGGSSSKATGGGNRFDLDWESNEAGRGGDALQEAQGINTTALAKLLPKGSVRAHTLGGISVSLGPQDYDALGGAAGVRAMLEKYAVIADEMTSGATGNMRRIFVLAPKGKGKKALPSEVPPSPAPNKATSTKPTPPTPAQASELAKQARMDARFSNLELEARRMRHAYLALG